MRALVQTSGLRKVIKCIIQLALVGVSGGGLDISVEENFWIT